MSDEELIRALEGYSRRIDESMARFEAQQKMDLLIKLADEAGDKQEPMVQPRPLGVAGADAIIDSLCDMFEELTTQYDLKQQQGQNTSVQFEMLLQYTPPLKGHVRLENIRRNLQGYRTPEGDILLPNDVQSQIIEEMLACAAPLIFQEEYDANPASICIRYGWTMSKGIMSILMPRKWGKSSLVSFAIGALMMEIPSFNHLNVSVTIDQGKLITHMIRDLLQNHVRIKNKEFLMKASSDSVRLFDSLRNERISECRASQVGVESSVVWGFEGLCIGVLVSVLLKQMSVMFSVVVVVVVVAVVVAVDQTKVRQVVTCTSSAYIRKPLQSVAS